MPSLLDIRRRIRSVKNTQQLTKAMKTVSAAKLRRAQERVVSARPYANQLRHVLANLAGRIENIEHPLLEVRPENRLLLLVVTADRGLCGGFNSNLTKAAQGFVRQHQDAQVQKCADRSRHCRRGAGLPLSAPPRLIRAAKAERPAGRP